MSDMNDFNTKVIAEFRGNEGRVGGPFEGASMLLLHSTGAKSGSERVHPLVYRPEGTTYVIFASKAGAPDNPAWYHNLKAHPVASIEVGTSTIAVTAREAEGEERDRLWAAQKSDVPQFGEYEASTTRIIPVVVLEPTG